MKLLFMYLVPFKLTTNAHTPVYSNQTKIPRSVKMMKYSEKKKLTKKWTTLILITDLFIIYV